MLILEPFTNDHGRLMLLPQGLTSLTLISRSGFSSSTLAYVLDSLVRVSRRDSKNHLTRSPKLPSATVATALGSVRPKPLAEP